MSDAQFIWVHAGIGRLQRGQFDSELARDGSFRFAGGDEVRARFGPQRTCVRNRRQWNRRGDGLWRKLAGRRRKIGIQCRRLAGIICAPSVHLVLQLPVFVGELLQLLLRSG